MKHLKVTTRIFGGFGLTLLLLIAVGAIGSLSLVKGNNDFVRYRSIALETVQAGRVQANLLEARLAVKNFIISANEDTIEAVKERATKTLDLNTELTGLVDDADKAKVTAETNRQLTEYLTAFDNVTDLQARRQNLVFNKLDKVGPQLERKLTEIMDSAHSDNDVESAYLAGKTIRNLLLARLYAAKYLVNNDEPSYIRVNKEMDLFQTTVGDMRASLENPNRRKLAAEVIEMSREYREAFKSVYSVINERNAIISATLDRIGPQIASDIETMKLDIKAEQDQLGPQATAEMNQAVILAISISIAAIVFCLAAAWYIGISISRPVVAMTQSMKHLADGNLDAEVPGADRRDEVGDMANAVQVFKDNAIEVRRLEKEREEVARHENEKRIAMNNLADGFSTTVTDVIDSVSAAVGQLTACAGSMEQVASNTSKQSTDVASASDQASTNVQTVSAATEELSASVQEISRQVQTSSSIASAAVEETNRATDEIRGLVNASQKIGEIVTLISDVAGQTNLLALNATIEAARAGDAGKGFAVVASEVKNLASQTSSATDQIASQIGSIQTATGTAMKAIESISSKVGEFDGIAASISAAVEQQGATTADISLNVQQAAEETQNVNQSITQASDGSRETELSAKNVTKATEELTRQSTLLADNVREFVDNIRAA